jgi:hypothetical protein
LQDFAAHEIDELKAALQIAEHRSFASDLELRRVLNESKQARLDFENKLSSLQLSQVQAVEKLQLSFEQRLESLQSNRAVDTTQQVSQTQIMLIEQLKSQLEASDQQRHDLASKQKLASQEMATLTATLRNSQTILEQTTKELELAKSNLAAVKWKSASDLAHEKRKLNEATVFAQRQLEASTQQASAYNATIVKTIEELQIQSAKTDQLTQELSDKCREANNLQQELLSKVKEIALLKAQAEESKKYAREAQEKATQIQLTLSNDRSLLEAQRAALESHLSELKNIEGKRNSELVAVQNQLQQYKANNASLSASLLENQQVLQSLKSDNERYSHIY